MSDLNNAINTRTEKSYDGPMTDRSVRIALSTTAKASYRDQIKGSHSIDEPKKEEKGK